MSSIENKYSKTKVLVKLFQKLAVSKGRAFGRCRNSEILFGKAEKFNCKTVKNQILKNKSETANKLTGKKSKSRNILHDSSRIFYGLLYFITGTSNVNSMVTLTVAVDNFKNVVHKKFTIDCQIFLQNLLQNAQPSVIIILA